MLEKLSDRNLVESSKRECQVLYLTRNNKTGIGGSHSARNQVGHYVEHQPGKASLPPKRLILVLNTLGKLLPASQERSALVRSCMEYFIQIWAP